MCNVVQVRDSILPNTIHCTAIVRLTDTVIEEDGAATTENDDRVLDQDGADCDLLDSREIESQLGRLISSLTDDMSALAMLKLLPRAKALYEQLHPDARHGGNRQVAKSANCPSFAKYVADHTGISQRSVYTRLENAERLATLDPQAETACFGCSIANKVGLLVRVAQLPEAEIQQDVVTIYRSAGSKRAKVELRNLEERFQLSKPAKSKHAPSPELGFADELSDKVDGDEPASAAETQRGSPIDSPHSALAAIFEVANEFVGEQAVLSEEQAVRVASARHYIHSHREATLGLLAKGITVLELADTVRVVAEAAGGYVMKSRNKDVSRRPMAFTRQVVASSGAANVSTDGADFTADWAWMTDSERDVHDTWVGELHDALVNLAESTSAQRDRVRELVCAREYEHPNELLSLLLDARADALRCAPRT